MATATSQIPDASGHFGLFGGKYVPETLMAALSELEAAYAAAKADPAFWAELNDLYHHYAGRPTPLYHAKRLSNVLGGAQIYLKREDLAHTAHTRSTTRWARGSSPGGSTSPASSRKRAPGSTAWLSPPCAPPWVWSAWSTWARWTSSAKASTSSA